MATKTSRANVAIKEDFKTVWYTLRLKVIFFLKDDLFIQKHVTKTCKTVLMR